MMAVITTVSKSPEQAATALLQYDNEYKLKALGTFNLPILQQTAKVCSNAVGWWEANGCEIPELQYVARRVLSLAIANSATERNWSIHEFLHSKRRNRLSFESQRKLVNVHVNLTLREKLLTGAAFNYFASDHSTDDEEPEGEASASESEKLQA